MNAEMLNNLFKPYIIKFQKLEDFKGLNPRLDKFIDNMTNPIKVKESMKAKECSKSADRLCANIDCPYNLLKYNYFDGDNDAS